MSAYNKGVENIVLMAGIFQLGGGNWACDSDGLELLSYEQTVDGTVGRFGTVNVPPINWGLAALVDRGVEL